MKFNDNNIIPTWFFHCASTVRMLYSIINRHSDTASRCNSGKSVDKTRNLKAVTRNLRSPGCNRLLSKLDENSSSSSFETLDPATCWNYGCSQNSFRWAQKSISAIWTFPRTSLMKNSKRKSFAIEFNSPIRRTSIFEQFPKRSKEELNFHFQFPSESMCTAISFELLFIYLFSRSFGEEREEKMGLPWESYDLKPIRHIGSQNKHFSIKRIVLAPWTPNTHHETIF